MNIYSICNDFLSIIIDNLESTYQDRDKETKKLIELLIGKSSLPRVIRDDIEEKGYNLTEDSLRKIMMATITSKAYLYQNYSIEKEIHPEDVLEAYKDMLETLEEMNCNDIINLFMIQDDIINYIIDDYYSYYDLTYIGQSQSKEIVFNDKEKLKSILRINPYILFEISEFIHKEDLLPTELMIQDFFDLYEEAFSCLSAEEEVEEDEIDLLDDEDAICFKKFLDLLSEKYTKVYVDQFLLYICGNVYELLSSNQKFLKNQKAKTMVSYLTETDTKEILNDLYTDYEFASIIIQYFYDNNMYISREELSKRRDKFKHKNKNLTRIKTLNPYFDSEEKLFTRKRSQSLD